MKSVWHRTGATAGIAIAAALAVSSLAHAETKIGKTLDEIIELAKQEPTVTLTTGVDVEHEFIGRAACCR